jgi:predicted Zn-dependent protease with MMP-like domain
MLVSDKRFQELVARAIEGLPRRFAELLDNVFVAVEDWPTVEDLESVGLASDEGEELLGLYHGVPQDERGSGYSELPDRVVLYREPILMVCANEDEVRLEVRDTLIHELGHHFGLDDDEMPY